MAMEPSRTEANRLYWQTDASVALIAERLGLSRRALYDLLEVAPAEPACPECGGALTFANRLARSTGAAYCATCAVNRAVAAVVRRAARAAAAPGEAVDGTPAEQGAEDGAPGARPPAGENGAARALPRRAANRPADARPRPAGPPPRRLQSADFALAIGIGLAAGVMAAFLFSRREP